MNKKIKELLLSLSASRQELAYELDDLKSEKLTNFMAALNSGTKTKADKAHAESMDVLENMAEQVAEMDRSITAAEDIVREHFAPYP